MSRRHIIMLMAATALAAPVLLAPAQTTGAYWNEQITTTLDDPQSDGFAITTANVTTTVPHTQTTPTIVANAPGASIKNNSTTHTSWIDVVSTRVTIPASNTTSTLLSTVNLDYAVKSTCTTALTDPYWDVNGGVGGASAGPTYTRTPAPVTGAELTPGQIQTVCPWVRPDYAVSTEAGRRAFLFAHAGRQLDIATTVRQKSFNAGTWTSNQEVINTRYQVKLPLPTRRSEDNVVCARTLSGGVWSSAGLFGRLYWAWPFAADGQKSSTTGTTAIDRFELIRSTDGGNTWAPFRKSIDQTSGAVYTTAGTPSGAQRLSESINSDHLNSNTSTPVFLSVRAFPYSGTTVYVDADWKVEVSEGTLALSDWFSCRSGGLPVDTASGVANANSSPVGLNLP